MELERVGSEVDREHMVMRTSVPLTSSAYGSKIPPIVSIEVLKMETEKPKEPVVKIKPGDKVIRRTRERRKRLKMAPRTPEIIRAFRGIVTQTPFLQMIILLIVLWLIFSAGIYFADRNASGTTITNYGNALYCAVAAYSTAGIANMPVTMAGKVLCALWMTFGSAIFFGAIVAGVTVYFMRPLQRPTKQIISTIEYNMEQLDKLSVDELKVLKETTDGLIDNHIRRREDQEEKDKDVV